MSDGGTDGVGGNTLSPSLYFQQVGSWEDLQVRLPQAASLFAPPPLLSGCGQFTLLGLYWDCLAASQLSCSPCHQLSTLTWLSLVVFGQTLTSSGLNAISLP